MESSSPPVPFPLLEDHRAYSPCTLHFRKGHDPEDKTTETEKIWIDVFRNSVPSFRKRAEEDDTVTDAPERAKRFAKRYLQMLDDLDKDPQTHGGPPDCLNLCRLREIVLREVGFEDIFRKVKGEENEKALALLPAVLKKIDSIQDPRERIEHLLRGVFAGNIFDLGAVSSAQMFEDHKMTFEGTYENLLPRPWVFDDLDKFIAAWLSKTWKKVILAVNEVPSINDITYTELLDVLAKLEERQEDEEMMVAVDKGRLMVVSSGSDLPVIDLSAVSPELAYVAEDADLVILEGMGRAIETNLYAKFRVDSLNLGMIKHKEVAEFLGGRLYDCVIRYSETKQAPSAVKLEVKRDPVVAMV
eukprot:jgi/Mesen1/6763/ME000346S05945